MYELRDQLSVMDSSELCALQMGTAYCKAIGTGTAWNFKMPDNDSSVVLKRMSRGMGHVCGCAHALKEKFGLDVGIHKDKNYFRLTLTNKALL